MKKIIPITGLIASFLCVIGMMMKIMHWPFAGIVMIVSFALFALLFLPVHGYRLFFNLNDNSSKLNGVLGSLLLSFLALSTLLKIFHWPGANIFFVLDYGILGLILCPLLMIQKILSSTTSIEKWLNFTWYLSVSLTSMGFLFKSMHWPGAGPLLVLCAVSTAFGYLPLAYKMYNNDRDRKKLYNRFIILPAVLVFVMLNAATVSKDIFNAFNVFENSNEQTTNHIREKNNLLFNEFPKGTVESDDKTPLYLAKAEKVKELSNALSNHIEKLKIHLMRSCDSGELAETPDDSLKLAFLNTKDNRDIPTNILIGDPDKPKKGAWSAIELKSKLCVFRQDLVSLFEGEDKTIMDKSIGLGTHDEYAIMDEQMVPWEMYYFYNLPVAVVIPILSKLEIDVNYAESIALDRLYARAKSEMAMHTKIIYMDHDTMIYNVPGGKIPSAKNK